MPFASNAQRRWMYATNPEMAKEWSKDTPKGKKLPEKLTDSDPKKTMKKAANVMVAVRRAKLWAKRIIG